MPNGAALRGFKDYTEEFNNPKLRASMVDSTFSNTVVGVNVQKYLEPVCYTFQH